VWLAALALLGGLAYWRDSAHRTLVDTDFVTGYILLGVIVFLALYNARKKLPMVPLGRASTWLTLHVVVGVSTLGLYWLHTGGLWPLGFADRVLAALFLLVSASGLAGYGLQLVIPGRLTRRGSEIIYERIPAEIARLGEAAEKAVLAAAQASGHDTLGRYYVETLAWYFVRPRFVASHVLGGGRARFWLRRRLETVAQHVGPAERPHLDALAALGWAKTALDTQYALQTLLKGWTMVHVPLAAAMLAFAAWHVILVHVYAR
jgi:hypothetical protein